MSPELRPLVEAAYAELERQGGETGHLVNREGVRGTTIELMGDFDLAPLVEAVLAAQREAENETGGRSLQGASGVPHRGDDQRLDEGAAPVKLGMAHIETVPRDGSRVILAAYCESRERWLFCTDYWRTYLDGVTQGFGVGFWDWATHWMPVPTPREVTDEVRAAQRQPWP